MEDNMREKLAKDKYLLDKYLKPILSDLGEINRRKKVIISQKRDIICFLNEFEEVLNKWWMLFFNWYRLFKLSKKICCQFGIFSKEIDIYLQDIHSSVEEYYMNSYVYYCGKNETEELKKTKVR